MSSICESMASHENLLEQHLIVAKLFHSLLYLAQSAVDSVVQVVLPVWQFLRAYIHLE